MNRLGLGLAVGLAFLKWMIDFIAKRTDRREDRVDAGTRALFDDHRAEIDRLKAECVELRAGLADCLRKHAEAEARELGLKAEMQGYGNARQHAQLIVSAEKLKDHEK